MSDCILPDHHSGPCKFPNKTEELRIEIISLRARLTASEQKVEELSSVIEILNTKAGQLERGCSFPEDEIQRAVVIDAREMLGAIHAIKSPDGKEGG